MATNIKVTTSRAASCVNAASNSQRIVSVDGRRWAYSRNRKRSTGRGTYDIVKSWVLKERGTDGNVRTVHTDSFESDARNFVGIDA